MERPTGRVRAGLAGISAALDRVPILAIAVLTIAEGNTGQHVVISSENNTAIAPSDFVAITDGT
jgi:hypothetical protein